MTLLLLGALAIASGIILYDVKKAVGSRTGIPEMIVILDSIDRELKEANTWLREANGILEKK